MNSDKSERNSRDLWVGVLIAAVGAVLWRLVPRLPGVSPEAQYLWNLAPVGGLALFAGARLRSGWAYVVALGAMLVSDLLLLPLLAAKGENAFSWVGTPLIYASYALYVFLGQRLIGREEKSPMVIGGASLLASILFFLLTNFAVWLSGEGNAYPHTLAGLAQCYTMALPFYRNTLAGDVLFAQFFFGVQALAVHVRALSKVRQPA
jgi:hypothetical protein